MMKTNRMSRSTPVRTHEEGKASRCSAEESLKRSVLSCLLWEDSFYEDGISIADRILQTIPKCSPEFVSTLAFQARKEYFLRHAPLLLLVGLARLGKLDAKAVERVISRADEMGELLSVFWMGKKTPIPAQIKKGLAKAFAKFDEYQLAKYNRKTEIKLRDVLRLVHPKPQDKEQADLWGRVINDELAVPYTWEVELSALGQEGLSGKELERARSDKWVELLESKRLGYMALLRNLRNMEGAGVPKKLVAEKLLAGAEKSKALPFRFISAAKMVPSWEDIIEPAMLLATQNMTPLKGLTRLLIDVSGSMGGSLSSRSILTTSDAANGLAMLCREVCDEVEIYTFSNDCVQIPPRHGFALADAIYDSQCHGGTYLSEALGKISRSAKEVADRLIIFTDEQSHDGFRCPSDIAEKTYIVNVASYENGVGYDKGTVHINGFSEAIVRYIVEIEEEFNAKD